MGYNRRAMQEFFDEMILKEQDQLEAGEAELVKTKEDREIAKSVMNMTAEQFA